MSYYVKRKEQLREEAMFFYDMFMILTWQKLQEYTDYFEKYGKRFGLLREFRENGII